MRLKLDENLPESLLPALGALGHDVDNHKQTLRQEFWGAGARNHGLRTHHPARHGVTDISEASSSMLTKRLACGVRMRPRRSTTP